MLAELQNSVAQKVEKGSTMGSRSAAIADVWLLIESDPGLAVGLGTECPGLATRAFS